MGKGKGPIEQWVARVASGTVMFHFQTNLTPKAALIVCNKAQTIIRVKTRIVQGSNTNRVGDSA
jgi:ribosomal protein L16/L10AE